MRPPLEAGPKHVEGVCAERGGEAASQAARPESHFTETEARKKKRKEDQPLEIHDSEK
jgi:hypothetical protein